MDPEEPICVRVADGLFIGNLAAAESTSELNKYGISAIVNVSGDDLVTRGILVNDYVLPNQELLPMERQRMIARLLPIKNTMVEMHKSHKKHTIMVCCYDGRNQSMLVVGYYMITALGMNPASVVKALETLYFTPELKHDDEVDQMRIANARPGESEEKFTPEQFQALQLSRETRRGLRGFITISFGTLLSSLGHSA